MINLPRRKAQIDVEVAEGVKLFLTPLSDDETVRIMEKTGLAEEKEVDPTAVKVPLADLVRYFQAKIRGAEGVMIEEEPFSAEDSSHVEAIPLTWKMQAMTALLSYAMTLPEETVKN